MRVYDLILKKREGKRLNREEIKYLIDGYTRGNIPDYQIAAWAMTVFFQGMDAEETVALTLAMAESGEQINLKDIKGIKVDKHSTGGVGDKTTLVLAPLVSAAGVPVAKMSGRGLGHTGGTIDKLEAIPGFKTSLSMSDFIDNVNKIGVAVVGQTGNLTPADKKLYALRDVTATVDSIPLIASSIMSKKIAGGADGIVLDVKVGDGAFMQNLNDARLLAKIMVDIGHKVDRRTMAVITDMNQPLGLAVGNALEVQEAIDTLKGDGPADLKELSLTLGSYMLLIARKADDFKQAYGLLEDILISGKALKQFKKLIALQGGNPSVVEETTLLPQAKYEIEVKSEQNGFVQHIKAQEIGLIAMTVGAGRKTKDDTIDLSAGIVLKKKYGDVVEKGDTLAVIYLNNKTISEEAVARTKDCFEIQKAQPDKKNLILDVLK